MVFVNTREACRQLGVHPNTFRSWDKAGKIKTQRIPGGIRLYDLRSLDGRYFLISPQSRYAKTPENQRLGCVATDPGVRTFVTL